MSGEDPEYYRARAAEEATLAKAAACEVAAKVHAELSLHYQALVALSEGRTGLGKPGLRPEREAAKSGRDTHQNCVLAALS